MQKRFLAGWTGLSWATAIAAVVLLSSAGVFASTTPFEKRKGDIDTTTLQGDATFRTPAMFPRTNYVWPYSAGPNYGQVEGAPWGEPGVFHTMVGVLDLRMGTPAFPAELITVNRLDKLGAQYFVLMIDPDAFADGRFDAIRSGIESQGGAIVYETATAAFVARLNRAAFEATNGQSGVIALQPYHPAYKLEPSIGRVPLPDPAMAISEVYRLAARLFPGENSMVVAEAIKNLGANVLSVEPETIRFEIDRSKLARVAALEPIFGIYEDLPVFPHGQETSATVQSGDGSLLGARPYTNAGLDGGGAAAGPGNEQILMVLDSGIQLDDGDLSDTKTSAGTAGPSHRKVRKYIAVNAGGWGGAGDDQGCDAFVSGRFTHGHVVSATALGNATAVPGSYGGGWIKTDGSGNPWDFDGLAPRALLVAYDANVTPTTLSCADPLASGLSVGTLYTTAGGGGGSMNDAYNLGARTVNFSWGTNNDSYLGDAQQVDTFLINKPDAMVFISAGNNGADIVPPGGDGFPDSGTTGSPASAKNAVCVGASDAGGGSSGNNRAGFSSVGPATPLGGRIAPIVMAPGIDFFGTGFAAEYSCVGDDNDSLSTTGGVRCDTLQGSSGTSFAAPAAAGAGMLVRDYFKQGFYPDGTSSNTGNSADLVSNVSGALVKAALIASTEWMGNSRIPTVPGQYTTLGGNLTYRGRFNNEQGYGKIRLTNALPLTTFPSAPGIIVCDGGIAGGRCDTGAVNGTIAAGATQTYTLKVNDNSKDLRVALAWIDGTTQGDNLVWNLDLELCPPSNPGCANAPTNPPTASNIKYFGNFFTDDNNRNRALNTIGTGPGLPEVDCTYTKGNTPWPPDNSAAGVIDYSAYSLPACNNNSGSTGGTNRDKVNPTEAIFLSPDPARDGITDNPQTGTVNEAADNQLAIGDWTLTVSNRAGSGSAQYALVIAGPVSLGSSTRVERILPDNTLGTGNLICNDKAQMTIQEFLDGTDDAINNDAAQIKLRSRLEVTKPGPDGQCNTNDDIVTDTESSTLNFVDTDGAGAGLKFELTSAIVLTDATAPEDNNGALDIENGQCVRAVYEDKTNGTTDPNKQRKSSLSVDCRAQIASGGVVWGNFGRDATTLVDGGCERDKRGWFTFGFPDKYMDAGETVGYRIAFQSVENDALDDARVSLKAVSVDGDSTTDCPPNTIPGAVCADPNRTNNPISPYLTILDSPKSIGRLAAGSAVSANFLVKVADSIPGGNPPEIEMLLGVSARKSGKPVESFAVSRHKLDVDEISFFYSTDFITGGSENRDSNENEEIEDPTTAVKDTNFRGDYIDESMVFSNAQATGRNTGLNTPWNFDTNNGGFKSGLNLASDFQIITATIANWGEDKDFDDVLDAGEDRDPAGSGLNQNWSTSGGCGWQTRGAGSTGGVWHTGTIRTTTPSTCTAVGGTNARCQTYETVPGLFFENVWWELLVTPKFSKVHQCPTGGELECNGRADVKDSGGFLTDPTYQVEFTNWAWNMEMDIKDVVSGVTWELDTGNTATASGQQLPIDLYNDFSILNALFGTQGAISGGNSPLTDGFSLFANISKCAPTGYLDGGGAPIKTCGGLTGGTVCTDDTPCTGNSIVGSQGTNRQGQNNCFFEGKTGGVAKAQLPYGLARPADNDAADGYCTWATETRDHQKSCNNNIDCPVADGYTGVCTKVDAVVDSFVTNNGPIRNLRMEMVNGPDMRYSILEDFYGDSGETFQGAIGFYTQEGSPSSPANSGFGAAIDDVVVEWREFRLDRDTTSCASGACAVLNIASTNFFEGNSFVQLSVVDSTPYDPVNNVNDCNGDGDYVDAGIDDQDCNNNSILDVTVRVTSEAEPVGEVAVLDRVGTSNEYKGNFPISASYNSTGVLYISRSGTDQPTVTARYNDRDTDGVPPVEPCLNDPDPAKRGTLFNSTTVFITAGRVDLRGIRIDDDNVGGTAGDNDGFADTNETIDLYLSFTNRSGIDLNNIVTSLQTDSPYIECIGQPTVTLGALANKAFAETPTPFRFKVANVNRTTVGEDFSATFTVAIRSDSFDTTTRTVSFTVPLDLNFTGGGSPTTFLESFEVASGFNQFTSMELDAGKASVAGSNGYRCQYNDPEGPNPNDPGRTSCFLGFVTASNNAYDWHIHRNDAANNNVGRSYTGVNSLHWGVHPSTGAKRDTTRFSQLDAIRTTNPIHVAAGAGALPELTFKHQASFTDSRITNTPAGEAADRGIVALQETDGAGNPLSDWIKLIPYENSYDVQGTDNFLNCTFDPIDDGSTEDDYFDPADPLRRTGPSSTCMPEFVFAWHGDTDYRHTAGNGQDPTFIGRADTGPGLIGATGPGTWIQPRFDLYSYRGKSLRLRFLTTTIEVEGAVTVNDTNIGADNEDGDDGWYLDDVQVTSALTSPGTLTVDTAPNTGFPVCPACTAISPSLVATPTSTGAPGQPVEVDASLSSADACPSGSLQFQFWNNINGNATIGDAGDLLLRDWTDNAVFTDAPLASTNYAVIVRCSTALSCDTASRTAQAPVTVTCPGSLGAVPFPGGPISFSNKTTITWGTSQTVDAIQGSLDLLRSTFGAFTGTVLSCIANDVTGTSVAAAGDPGGGSAFYYLVRRNGEIGCNGGDSWSTGHPKEQTGRDVEIQADAATCP